MQNINCLIYPQSSFLTLDTLLSITYIEASIIPTLTIALTEMVQCHPPMSLPASNTPPDSLGLLPIVILNDEQAREIANAIAAIKIAPTIPSSHLPSSENLLRNLPPSLATLCSPTPCQTCSTKEPSQVAVEFAKQIIEALKSINAKQGPPPPPPVELSGAKNTKARASTLEFKTVSEV